MFIYLSKKIAIPNNTKLNCLAWSSSQGYIAVGGDEGLLKVLKLDSGKEGKVKGLAAAPNLSMNQTLEGHNGQIQVVVWNEVHQKLTSSDQNGLIIVWMMYKGSWYEEMINNRNKSVVRGMVWNSDGQRICIVYEDGAVIVGSVDGSRIWGNELKGTALTGVQWSPDSKLLLFSLRTGEIHAYNSQGTFMMKVNIKCVSLTSGSTALQVVGMDWYNGRHGYVEENCPCLAICYNNGSMQIMRHQSDDSPNVLDTGMAAVCCRWNHDGSVLAVVGMATLAGEVKDSNVVQFYNTFAQHLRTLKVPGKEVTSCVWEGRSLRVALAVDSFIYFINVRPDYKWCYLAQTVVYSYTQPDRLGTTVVFWDTKNNECYTKTVKALLGVTSHGDHCLLATKAEDPTDGKYGLLVCNSISTPVDTKFIDIEPLWTAMNSTHVIAASKSNFLLWHFRSPKSHSSQHGSGNRQKKDRMYHIDDTPSGVAEVIQDLDRNFELPTNTKGTADPVCCIAASDNVLMIGRESGMLQRYSLPQVALTNRYTLNSQPYHIAINCNSTKLSVIDTVGYLSILELDVDLNRIPGDGPSSGQTATQADRKDVWAMRWAADNPDLLAIMEKTRMYVLRGLDPEEPVVSSGYICSFQDLEIRAVLLDELLQNPDEPSAEFLLDLEVKSLRDTRQLLEKVGIKEATTFIEENPHPRLWRLLAEAAILELDLATAEAAFVRCSDYPGIQFIKRLSNIHNDQLKKAEVAAYFKNFNDAEKMYLDADRRDLAIALRERLGDWFRVVQLMKMGPGGTDVQMEQAWNSIGDYFADRNNWEAAREYYEKGRNQEKLVHCYFVVEDYAALETLVSSLTDKHALLLRIAEIFASVGMCSQAVAAFIKYGAVKSAVDTCVSLNQWDQAVELARLYQLPEISNLLAQYAVHLLEKNRLMEAVELYRKANHFLQASKLLYQLAERESKLKSSPLRVKKLYVLAALLVEEHNAYHKQQALASAGGKSKALMGIFDSEDGVEVDSQIVDNAWRGAEAYHFLMMAQRQLYQGMVDAAMKTALHLQDYDDILDPEDVYCILALASCANRAFGTCSKAFIRLETLHQISPDKKQEYEELALDIFMKYTPKDPRGSKSECSNCSAVIPDWSWICSSCDTRFPACTATGKPLTNVSNVWTCNVCKHLASYNDASVRDNCPLCHSRVIL